MPVVARIAGVPLSREADPRGILDLLLAAFLGASLALCLSYLLRGFRRARRRKLAVGRGAIGGSGSKPSSGSGDSPRGDLPPECEQIACGLQEFAKEVEGRLDRRLDRLERLLKAADLVLRSNGLGRSGNRGGAGEIRSPEAAGATSEECAEHGEAPPSAEDSRETVRAITEEERERVLELAAVGQSPEAISQAVGLLRGEVDLILRLFGRETPG